MLIANRYEPTGAAAWGGMGEVHRCIDQHLDREVMIKKMLPGEDIDRLLDEQKALAKLRSKHVVQLLDIVEVDGIGSKDTCIVLEYVEGNDLQERSFEPNEHYLKTLWQVASGLTDIHAAGIIHRDIKPENIRVDREGIAKILDFGLAREEGKDDKTRSIIGTVGYMAPELWGDVTISFSSAIDVYAFAVTSLALLDRDLPSEFHTRPPKEIPKGIITAIAPEISPEIIEIIEQSLSFNAADRPKISDIKHILSRHLLKDKHRARMVMGDTVYELDAGRRNVNLTSPIGNLHVHYDGLRFRIQNVGGEVWINNGNAVQGMEMPPACVITFGNAGRRGRNFLTFDVSNPEVMA